MGNGLPSSLQKVTGYLDVPAKAYVKWANLLKKGDGMGIAEKGSRMSLKTMRFN